MIMAMHVNQAAPSAMRPLAIPLIATAAAVAFALVATTRWDIWTGHAAMQQTDDAFIRAEMTRLSSRVAGAVHTVAVQDFQRVHAGDLLLEVDPADYAVQVRQAEAALAAAHAVLETLAGQQALQAATIAQVEAQHGSMEARELQARQERSRQEALVQSSFGTRQKLESALADHAKALGDLRASAASIDAQRRQLEVLTATQKQRVADIQAAEAGLAAARLRLGYTTVTAPFDGVVGERQVQAGDYVTIGSSLVTVVPLPAVYVIANYKETQLTRVSPGQVADITVDTFPGETLHGRVQSLSPASGSQFALLPPDNASGNFTKVVQRIPVRIALDPDQPLLDRLRPGMSVTARIHTDEPGELHR